MKTFKETESLVIFDRKTGELREDQVLSKSEIYIYQNRQVLDLSIPQRTFVLPCNSWISYLGVKVFSTSMEILRLELRESVVNYENQYQNAKRELTLFEENLKNIAL